MYQQQKYRLHQNNPNTNLRNHLRKTTASTEPSSIITDHPLAFVVLICLPFFAAYYTRRLRRQRQQIRLRNTASVSFESSSSNSGLFALVLAHLIRLVRQRYDGTGSVRLDDNGYSYSLDAEEQGVGSEGGSPGSGRKNGTTKGREDVAEAERCEMKELGVGGYATFAVDQLPNVSGKDDGSRIGLLVSSLEIENSSPSQPPPSGLDDRPTSPSPSREATSDAQTIPSTPQPRKSGLHPPGPEIMQRMKAITARLQTQPPPPSPGTIPVPALCGSIQVKGIGEVGEMERCYYHDVKRIPSWDVVGLASASSLSAGRERGGRVGCESASQSDEEEDEQLPIREYDVPQERDFEHVVTERNDKQSILAPSLPPDYIPPTTSRRPSASVAWGKVKRTTKVKRSGVLDEELVNSGSMLVKGVRDRGDWEIEMDDETTRRSSY